VISNFLEIVRTINSGAHPAALFLPELFAKTVSLVQPVTSWFDDENS